MKISVVPFYKTELNNKLFDRNALYNNGYHLKQALEKNGHEVATIDLMPVDVADFIILFDLDLATLWDLFLHHKNNRAVYLPFEPPAVFSWHEACFLKKLAGFIPFILTWQDELIDNIHFFKMYFPYRNILEKQAIIPFSQKKLVTQVSGYKNSRHPHELYSKRIEMIRFFEKACPQDFDFYGTNWPQDAFPSYQGQIEDKFAVISHYKFAVCFENQAKIRGYITEKILDCFHARVVPIYWGADNIEDYIPKTALIDYRDFTSNEALLDFLQNMPESKHEAYLLAGQAFLASKAYQKFLPSAFANEVAEFVQTHQNYPALPYSRWKILWLLLVLFEKKSYGSFLRKRLSQGKRILKYWLKRNKA